MKERAKVIACVIGWTWLISTPALAQTPEIDSISPSPYMPGRTLFTISGFGFANGATVTVDSSSYDASQVVLDQPEVEVVSSQLIRIDLMARDATDIWHGLDGLGATFAVENPGGERSNEEFVAASPLTIHVVFMTHLDIGYTAPPSQVAEDYKDFYDLVLAMIQADNPPDEDTRVRFTVETIWQLEQFMERSAPEDVSLFFDFVQQGLIEICAGYNTPNTSSIGHEDMGRLFYPAAELREGYGIPIETLIFNDQPGYGWGVADVAMASGIRYLLTGINIMDGASIGGHPFLVQDVPFHWVGRTGERLLTWPSIGEVSQPNPWDAPVTIRNGAYAEATADYNMFLLEPWIGPFSDPEWDDEHVLGRVIKGLGYFADREYSYRDILIMGANADNNCDYGLLEGYGMEAFDTFQAVTLAIRQINRTVDNPHIVITTPTPFFRMMEQTYGPFPEMPAAGSGHGGDWPSHWESCDAAAPRSTALLRAARQMAPAVEKLAALNQILGSTDQYPTDELAGLWRLIRTWDGHTAAGHLPDSKTDDPNWLGWLDWDDALQHDEEHVRFAVNAHSISRELADQQMTLLGELVTGREHDRVVVYNPTGWTRTDLVTVQLHDQGAFDLVDMETGQGVGYQTSALEEGLVLFAARDVPPNGYRVYEVRYGGSSPSFEADLELDLSQRRIENAFYRITLDENGFPREVFDKTLGRDIIDHQAPFRFLGLAGINLLAAGFNGFGLDSVLPTEPDPDGGQIQVGEEGPVAASLLTTRPGRPLASMEIRLLDGTKRVDIRVHIDLDRLDPVEYLSSHMTGWHMAFPFAVDPDGLKMQVDTASGYLDPFEDGIPGAFNDLVYVTHGLRMADGQTGVELSSAEPFIVDLPTSEGLIARVAGMANGLTRPAFATILSYFFKDMRHDLMTYPDGPPDDPGDQDPLTDGYQAYPVVEPGLDSILTLSYRFRTGEALDFNAGETASFLAGVNNPLLAVVVAASANAPQDDRCLPGSGSLVRVDLADVEVSGFKRARSGQGYVVRLREIAGRPCTAVVSSDLFEIVSARRVNLVEEPDEAESPVSVEAGVARLELKAHEMAAVKLDGLTLKDMDCQPTGGGGRGCRCSHGGSLGEGFLLLLILAAFFVVIGSRRSRRRCGDVDCRSS